MASSNPAAAAPAVFGTQCCTIPPAKPLAEYVNAGVFIELEVAGGERPPVRCYSVGAGSSDKAVVVYYDIFGFHKNTEQTCDMIASQGYWVIIPDIF
ncbi:hypothetical protein HK405_000386, partial [Cladochytrium tenue]